MRDGEVADVSCEFIKKSPVGFVEVPSVSSVDWGIWPLMTDNDGSDWCHTSINVFTMTEGIQ